MSVREIGPGYYVTGQIRPEDLPAIANAGFKSVICNRPDGEDPGQPNYESVAEAARQAGLQVRFLPADSGRVTPAHGQELAQLLEGLPSPVLAYCRSGTRSTSMWSFAQAFRGGSEAGEGH